MSEMVERVARAIEGSLNSDLEDAWRQAARAAIRAMRDPTDAMVTDADGHRYSAEVETWQRMIDEAMAVTAENAS